MNFRQSTKLTKIEAGYGEQIAIKIENKVKQQMLLKDRFIHNYGITFKVPTYYIQSAKFIPKSKNLYLVWENHNFPQNSEVYSLSVDGNTGNRDQEYEEKMKQMKSVIKLWKQDGTEIILEKQVNLKEMLSGLFRFSRSGKRIVVAGRDNQELSIYDASDVIGMMEDVRESRTLVSYFNADFKNIKKVQFSKDDKTLLCIFQTYIMFYNLTDLESNQPTKIIDIPSYYSRIIEVKADHTGKDVMVVCQRKEDQNVDVFQLKTPKKYRTIRYENYKPDFILKAKISCDGEQVFLNTGNESILLKGNRQYLLRWFEVKQVCKIQPYAKGFLCLCCKGYDTEIDVLYTNDPKFKFHFPRKQTPGSTIFFDIKVFGNQLKVASGRDDEFFLDILDIKKDQYILPYRNRFYKSYVFQWPFFAFISEDSDILIQSVFKPKQILRLERHYSSTDEEDQKITNIDITENLNLFYLVKQGDQFKLFQLDLDNFIIQFQPIFVYDAAQINNLPPFDIFVRSSTKNDHADCGFEDIVIIQHRFDLYITSQSKQLEYLGKLDKMSEIKSINDSFYFFMREGENSVSKLVLSYSSYEVQEVFKEKEKNSRLKSFALNCNNKLYILIRFKSDLSKSYYLKIFDLQTEKVEHKIQLIHQDLIGQMLSGNYQFLNDIFYYQNNIIKLNTLNLGKADDCDMIFQDYKQVLNLKQGQSIANNSPMMNQKFKRLLFLVRDLKMFSEKEAIVLPYFCERKLYFNTKNTPQFCTLTEKVQSPKKNQKENKKEYFSEKLILNINPLLNQAFYYNIKGVLLKKQPLIPQGCLLGQPKTFSSDGKNFVIKEEKNLKFHIITIDFDGPKLVKTVDLVQEFEQNQFLQEQFPNIMDNIYDKNKPLKVTVQINNNLDLVFFLDIKLMKKNRKVNGSKSQHTIIEQRILKNKKTSLQLKEDNIQTGSGEVFLYIRGQTQNYYQSPSVQVINSSTHLKSNTKIVGYKLGYNYIYFWSYTHIYYYDMKNQVSQQLSFQIPQKSSGMEVDETFIKKIDISGQPKGDPIITLSLNSQLDQIIVWDLKKYNCESDSFDVSPKASVIFDAKGQGYIVDNDFLYVCKQGCRLNQFKLGLQDFDWNFVFDGMDKGFRVCENNMEYVLLRNSIMLPYCYFNLVYKQELGSKVITEENFDIDGFSYIIDQNCELHQLALQYVNLDFIMKKYEQHNFSGLDSLMLANNQKQTPLHLAIQRKNNRSVSIILQRLSQININSTKPMKDIFDDLLQFTQFSLYLEESFFQTIQMKQLTSFKMGDKTSWIETHTNTYLDQSFYDKIYNKDQQNQQNVPVQIKGIDVWWILNTKEGYRFLYKLSTVKDVSFLTAACSKTIIDFLWSYYSKKITIYIGIPYFLYFVVFLSLIFYMENRIYNHQNSEKNHYIYEGPEQAFRTFIIAMNFIFIIYFLYILVRRIMTQKWKFFKTLWGNVQILSTILNVTVYGMILKESEITFIRKVSSFAVVIMWFQLLYYLRIFSRMAPLIRNIQEILIDMRSFLVIFFLTIFAMAHGFFILGKNQLYRYDVSEENVPYKDFRYSFLYVYMSVVGEYNSDQFENGDEHLLWLFFFISTIFLQIVMLNMLVAVMGSTFERVEVTAEGALLRERLSLIMENLFLPQIKDLKKTKYLISINIVDEVNDQNQLIRSIGQMSQGLIQDVKKLRERIYNEVK